MQRTILTKLGCESPTAEIPNYWRRSENREELPELAEALIRCIEPVPVEKEAPPHEDLGRVLLRTFSPAGIAPVRAAVGGGRPALRGPATFTTFDLDPLATYLCAPTRQDRDAHGTRRYAVTYAGHGMNSYASTVRLERPGSAAHGAVLIWRCLR